MPADPPPPPTPLPVEAILRDAARKRRAKFDAEAGPGAGTMPAPMRTRLHAELAKRFNDAPAPAAPTTPGWLARWWPVLAGTFGAAAAVALFVVANPRPARTPVTSAPAAKVLAPAPPNVDAPVKETGAAAPSNQVAAADQSAAFAKDKLESTVSAPPATPELVRSQTFIQAPLLPLAAAATTAPRGEALARRAAPSSADTRRAGAPAPAAAPVVPSVDTPAPLLGNFRFEQRGENVRVVDADGSVYVGQVEPEAAKTSAMTQAKVAEIPQPSPENFRFRAMGDNRTLRKPVVFEGQYSGNAADAPAAANNQQTAVASKPSNAAAAPTPEAQIRGRVRVLDERNAAASRDAEVDARSVEPVAPR